MKTELYFKKDGSWERLDVLTMVYILQKMPPISDKNPDGQGTEFAPWRMSSIEQWLGAAKQVIAPRSAAPASGMTADEALKAKREYRGDLYVIGGQLIERNPSTGGFADYTSDVLDAMPVVSTTGQKPPLGVTDMKRPRMFPSPDRTDRRPIYTKKYERIAEGRSALEIDHPALARQARELLAGAQSMTTQPNHELPGAVAALFIAEVKREWRMLPLGLMLLDLIEVGARYGTSAGEEKTYTFEALMAGQPAHDGGSDTASSSSAIDRSQGAKHPMCRDNSITDAKAMFQSLNAVTRKSVSVLVAWLSLYLRQQATGWQVEVGRTKSPAPTAAPPGIAKAQLTQREEKLTDPSGLKGGMFYHAAVLEALKKRCASVDCLLTAAKDSPKDVTLAYRSA